MYKLRSDSLILNEDDDDDDDDLMTIYADKIQAGRWQRIRRRKFCIDEDKNIEFDERHLAELVRRNMRANNVYVPTGYRLLLCCAYVCVIAVPSMALSTL